MSRAYSPPTKASLASAPAWVAWIAQDEDGAWWGYAHEPNRGDHGWYENEVGDNTRLGAAAPNANWADTLIERGALS